MAKKRTDFAEGKLPLSMDILRKRAEEVLKKRLPAKKGDSLSGHARLMHEQGDVIRFQQGRRQRRENELSGIPALPAIECICL